MTTGSVVEIVMAGVFGSELTHLPVYVPPEVIWIGDEVPEVEDTGSVVDLLVNGVELPLHPAMAPIAKQEDKSITDNLVCIILPTDSRVNLFSVPIGRASLFVKYIFRYKLLVYYVRDVLVRF